MKLFTRIILLLGESINASAHKTNLVKFERKGNLVSSEVYAIKHAYGYLGEDDSDDENSDLFYVDKYNEATPNTRK